MKEIKNWTWILLFFLYTMLAGCAHENHTSLINDIQQCKKDSIDFNNCQKENALSCIELPYYNDKSATAELLSFILHGEKHATIKNGQSEQMQILYKTSGWGAEYKLRVKFEDHNQLLKICHENTRDWFNSRKKFLMAFQQKYLNVAKKG